MGFDKLFALTRPDSRSFFLGYLERLKQRVWAIGRNAQAYVLPQNGYFPIAGTGANGHFALFSAGLLGVPDR
jgi:hypothetical protein